MSNQCPVCDTPYQLETQKCPTCDWDLSIYSQSYSQNFINTVRSGLNDKVPRSVEVWAKDKWRKLKHYEVELDKKEQEAKRWRADIVNELTTKVEFLEQKLEHLETANNLKGELSMLRNDILNDLDQRINQIVKQYFDELNFDEKFWEVEQSLISKFSSANYTSVFNTSSSTSDNISLEQQPDSMIEITPEAQSVIETYYENPDFLTKYISKVSPTKQTLEDIYLNKAVNIIFKKSNQSDFWIVKMSSGNYYLVPDINLKINTNIKTIRMIFELENYRDDQPKEFKLIKPAKVSSHNDEEWQLLEQGCLQF